MPATIQIAQNPCIPFYGVVVGEKELWDCDCASNSEKDTLKLAKEQYPHSTIIMWDDPKHYSNKKQL